MHGPDVLFLDEPFEAVDPVSTRTIRVVLERFTAAGHTVVFSSPLTTADKCTELMAVSVALRKNGRKPGKMVLKTTAMGTSRRMRDPDKIRLVCVP